MTSMSYSDYALLMLIMLAGLFIILKIIELTMKLKQRFSRGKQQVGKVDVTPDRWQQIREDTEDVLEEGIAALMTTGKWTKEEGAAIKKMFANIYDLKGLIPRGHLTLREQLVQSLAAIGRLPAKFKQVAPAPPAQKVKSAEALRAMFTKN